MTINASHFTASLSWGKWCFQNHLHRKSNPPTLSDSRARALTVNRGLWPAIWTDDSSIVDYHSRLCWLYKWHTLALIIFGRNYQTLLFKVPLVHVVPQAALPLCPKANPSSVELIGRRILNRPWYVRMNCLNRFLVVRQHRITHMRNPLTLTLACFAPSLDGREHVVCCSQLQIAG